MNRTISINLGGIFFHIEEDAYHQLEAYLNSITTYFSEEEGANEIVEDIEARISEMFTEALGKHKRQVVLPSDVDVVISIMGHPEEFDEPIGSESATKGERQQTAYGEAAGSDKRSNRQQRQEHRQLFRNPDEKVVGGVCSGISAYFGIQDPIWVRLAFVVAIFFFGMSPLLYILLWVIVPEATTSAQKLSMKGEAVNVSNLEKTFREGVNNLKDKIEDYSKGEDGQKIRFFFRRFTNFLVALLPLVLIFGVKVAKVLVVFVGLALVFSLAIGLIGGLVAVFASFGFLNNFVFNSMMPVVVTSVSSALLVLIPIVLITNGLLSRSFKVRPRSRRWKRALGVLWILSLVSLITIGGNTYANDFHGERTFENTEFLTQPADNVITIETMNQQQLGHIKSGHTVNIDIPIGNMHRTVFDTETQAIFIKDVIIDVEKSDDHEFKLRERLYVNGNPIHDFISDQISYGYVQDGSVLRLNPYYEVPAGNKWRNQKLHLTLLVPEGKAVHFGATSGDIIYDVKNVTNTWDGDMINKTWVMTPEGLAMAQNGRASNQNGTGATSTSGSSVFKNPYLTGDATDESIAYTIQKTISETAQDFINTAFNELPELKGAVTKEFDLKDFSKLDFQGRFEIYVKKGDHYAVKVGGSQEDLDKLNLRKRVSTLKAEVDEGWFTNKQQEAIHVHITTPELSKVELTGMSKCYAGAFTQDRVSIDLSGLSSFKGTFTADRIEAETSGASELTLYGATEKLVMDVSGASKVDASELQAEKGYVDVSGASSTTVFTTEYLQGDASGASVLRFKGEPENSRTETSGASAIVKMD